MRTIAPMTQTMENLWIIESGTFVHITNEKSKLSNLRPLDKHIPVKTVDDAILNIKECGDLYIDKTLVRNVLYNENVTANLLSFVKLKEKGLLVSNGNEFKLKQKNVSIPIAFRSGVLIIDQKIKNDRVDDEKPDVALKHIKKSDDLKLECFSDASFAPSNADLKSITGMACYLNNDLFYWSTKRQTKVARFTFIVELFALVYGYGSKAKAVDIDFIYLKECLKEIEVMHVNSEEMLADSLTKPFSSERLMDVFIGRGKVLNK
uniref:Ribonuclease H-like domain-containing protein n=1 Tax=Strongyloides venezuelensis TaxID=75913 RepID=A0A0K0FPR4_STRVS